MSHPPVRPPPPETMPCSTCHETMHWTGLPNVAGPVYVRFYRCPTCGVVKVPVKKESPVGWG